jgi:hypothetical protein
VHMAIPRQCVYFRFVVQSQRCSELVGHLPLRKCGLSLGAFECDVPLSGGKSVQLSERVAQFVYPQDDTEEAAI